MERKFDSLEAIARSIPEDWSIKERARAAYLKLGANCFYNTKFNHLFGYPQVDIFNETDGFSIPNIGVCKKFTNQYLMLLTKMGIKCHEFREETDDFGMYHNDAIFFDEDGEDYIVNLAIDLARIQSNSSTVGFADTIISPEELRDIDLKIGYITQSKGYTDEYTKQLRAYMEGYDLSQSEKVDMMFRIFPKFFDFSSMGDEEQVKTVRYFLGKVFGWKDATLCRSYNHDKGEEDYYIKCFDEAKPGVPPRTVYHFFNKQTRTYEPIDYKELVASGIIKNTQKYH